MYYFYFKQLFLSTYFYSNIIQSSHFADIIYSILKGGVFMIDEINTNGNDESKTDESVNKSDTTENVYGVIYTPDKDRNEYIAVNYKKQRLWNKKEAKE